MITTVFVIIVVLGVENKGAKIKSYKKGDSEAYLKDVESEIGFRDAIMELKNKIEDFNCPLSFYL